MVLQSAQRLNKHRGITTNLGDAMMKNKRTHFMAGVLMCLFVGAFLIIVGRVLYIQAVGQVDGVSLKEWAEDKRTSTYYLNSERGKILDSNGMTLAYDRMNYRLYAILDEEYSSQSKEPKHLHDPEKAAELLAPVLDLEEDALLERIEERIEAGQDQIEFGSAGRSLSLDEKEEIEALDIPGLYFEKEPSRYYPNGVFASHILGFARNETMEDSNEEVITGITGIEKVKNDILSGEDGYVSYQKDKYQKKLLDPKEIVKEPVDGQQIFLTIDQKVQILLEDIMTEVEEEYEPERMTAVIMKAKTGEIVAMSNRPSYDPNNPVDVVNWYNDVISTPYEPGSTVKMFTWAAAIDSGNYNGDETYKSGSYQINPTVAKINDHNGGKGWGKITFDEGFARSSNVAASKLVWEKMGPELFLEYLEAFDFDKITGIDLPGEVSGRILYNWPREKLTTSFGQGSTVTPIQQVKAATAIANDGKMMQPYVIKEIVDSDTGEAVESTSPTVVSEPITSETAEQVRGLLDSVVNGENGTGKAFKLDNYSVIGKTGTAQIAKDGNYLSGENNNIYSFLGMAPKDDPELIMYVSVTQPKTEDNETGATPVSYIFRNVLENSLNYLNIAPDKDDHDTIQTFEVPEFAGKSTASVEKELEELGVQSTVIGDGDQITHANVQPGEQMFFNDRLILLTDEPTMPDITGWSLRDAIELASLLDLEIEHIGNGYVMTQSIKKGTSIKKGDYLGIELESPIDEKKQKSSNDDNEQATEDEDTSMVNNEP